MRIRQIDAAERNLIIELNNAAGMPPKAADAYRTRIRHQFVTLYGERETITGQLDALDNNAGLHGTDPALLDELPEIGRLDELPERLQAELFTAFDIQILWNLPLKQATFFGRVAPAHYCTGAPSGPGMHVPAHHGPSKPQGRLRLSAASRWFPPTGADACFGGRLRVRGVFAGCVRRWACRDGPGSPPRSPS